MSKNTNEMEKNTEFKDELLKVKMSIDEDDDDAEDSKFKGGKKTPERKVR